MSDHEGPLGGKCGRSLTVGQLEIVTDNWSYAPRQRSERKHISETKHREIDEILGAGSTVSCRQAAERRDL